MLSEPPKTPQTVWNALGVNFSCKQQLSHNRIAFKANSRYSDCIWLNRILSVCIIYQLHLICIWDEIRLECAKIVLGIFETDLYNSNDILTNCPLFKIPMQMWIELRKICILVGSGWFLSIQYNVAGALNIMHYSWAICKMIDIKFCLAFRIPAWFAGDLSMFDGGNESR